MERQRVYFDRRAQRFVTDGMQCEVCNNWFVGYGFWFTDWSKTQLPSGHRFVCNYCIGNEDKSKNWPPVGFSKLHAVCEAKTVQVVRRIPANAQMIADLPPVLGVARHTDCFAEAEKELQAHPEKYRHLVSSNPERNAELGFVNGKELLEKKDEELVAITSEQEVEDYLKELQSHEPAIAGEEQKKIEVKDDGL